MAYPFGHGLSYTRFAHSDFALDRETLTATLRVTSTGRVLGAEVVPIYALREDEPDFQSQLVGFWQDHAGGWGE
ncbi:hypothetical protein AA0535_0681 [Asaia krungthepensis NRIC 0535]|uniref:Uncharacterized protein n=1 Tax=Asaia krungthepensis NRIC 0535 TaxID=1307925 RepID=A0ABQ0PZ22_9PROT|nr:hypothetical protein AA0535_0681 [Asaia krungthepensis NRIC 0535]